MRLWAMGSVARKASASRSAQPASSVAATTVSIPNHDKQRRDGRVILRTKSDVVDIVHRRQFVGAADELHPVAIPVLHLCPGDETSPAFDSTEYGLEERRSFDTMTVVAEAHSDAAGADHEAVDPQSGAKSLDEGTVLDETNVVDRPDDIAIDVNHIAA